MADNNPDLESQVLRSLLQDSGSGVPSEWHIQPDESARRQQLQQAQPIPPPPHQVQSNRYSVAVHPSHKSSIPDTSHSSSSGRRSSKRRLPTDSSSSASGAPPTKRRRLQGFLCNPRFRSRLPPPPLNLKFLKYPHSKDRFTRYCASTLELNYAWPFHCESLVPLPLELMDPTYYDPPLPPSSDDDTNEENTSLHPSDAGILRLLKRRAARTEGGEKKKAAGAGDESFLLNPIYLVPKNDVLFGDTQMELRNRRRSEAKPAADASLEASAATIEAIQQTFEDVKQVRHPKRTHLKVVEALDVFPHDKLLETRYTHVQFNHNPSTQTKKLPFMPRRRQQRETVAVSSAANCVMRRSYIDGRSVSPAANAAIADESNVTQNEIHTLYAPNPANLVTANSEMPTTEEKATNEYEWVADYVPTQEQNKTLHFLVMGPEDVYYASFHKRLNLRHRPVGPEFADAKSAAASGLSTDELKHFKELPATVSLTEPLVDPEDIDDEFNEEY